MTQLEIIIALENENKRLRESLVEAVDLVVNSKTKTIGPYCEEMALRWQRVLDAEPFEVRVAPSSDRPNQGTGYLPRVDEIPQGSFYCRGCRSVVRMRHLCPGPRRRA